MNKNVIDEMMKSGLYRFWMGNQLFYIEVLPIAFQVNGYNFYEKKPKRCYCSTWKRKYL